MDLYLDNMVSQWKTKLSEFIELKEKWEVGLLKVLFPGKVYNIFGSDFGFTMQGGLLNNVCVLRVEIYETIVSSVQNESGLHYGAVGRRQRASSISFLRTVARHNYIYGACMTWLLGVSHLRPGDDAWLQGESMIWLQESQSREEW